jgi:hypothetical protein
MLDVDVLVWINGLHLVVALLFAGAGSEGVGDVHGEHGLVESCKGSVSMSSKE